MRRIAIVCATLLFVAVSWNTLTGRQGAHPQPGVGSGVAEVRGTVTVSALPPITVAAMPPVTIASHEFVRPGARYAIDWPNGDREDVTVADVGRAGWIRVGRGRWVNIDAARSVELK